MLLIYWMYFLHQTRFFQPRSSSAPAGGVDPGFCRGGQLAMRQQAAGGHWDASWELVQEKNMFRSVHIINIYIYMYIHMYVYNAYTYLHICVHIDICTHMIYNTHICISEKLKKTWMATSLRKRYKQPFKQWKAFERWAIGVWRRAEKKSQTIDVSLVLHREVVFFF